MQECGCGHCRRSLFVWTNSIDMHPHLTLALFCKVVDNFGDIGICWRLSRQLQDEHRIAVTLWVDDLQSFRRICPQVRVDRARQDIGGVTVRHWQQQVDVFAARDVADIVIEFFGCDIPEGYIAAMAGCATPPVWLNLEGLTAEAWVEGCHTLPSPHPRLSLTKYFFYPGFTSKTGGLLHESRLGEQRRAFQSDPVAIATFLSQLGVTPAEQAARKVSLFCYPHAPVAALLTTLEHGAEPITCLVPEGVATDAIAAFIGGEATPGVACSRGALTVRVLPFVSQPDYDRLLWACDINFVRGEDSFVRAQWAGKPFIWHIYPQEKDLHHVKLRAFLQRFATGCDALVALSLLWNAVPIPGRVAPPDWSATWSAFLAELPTIEAQVEAWVHRVLANGDLVANLLAFAAAIRSKAGENKV